MFNQNNIPRKLLHISQELRVVSGVIVNKDAKMPPRARHSDKDKNDVKSKVEMPQGSL